MTSGGVDLMCIVIYQLWLLFVSEKGNELSQNGRVMKGLLFTCYHGNHNVQSIIYSGLCVRPTSFNYLGEQYHSSA